MKRLGLILLSCTLAACTTYKTADRDSMTIGKASITKCDEMVWPDGMADGKESIGFHCERQESDHIGNEAAVIFEAGINAIVGTIPGLPVVIKWFNGLGK